MGAYAAYAELARIRLLSLLAHRANFYTGILVYTINVAGYALFWVAVYAGRDQVGGLTLDQMLTYLAMGYMARAFYFNDLDFEVANDVRDGTVAVLLTRPLPYLGQKVALAVGQAVFRAAFVSLPGLALLALFLPLRLPPAGVWLPFAASLILAFVLNAQINLLTGLVAVWSPRIRGVVWARRLVVDFLSGVYLPISLWPPAVRVALEWSPLPCIAYVPSLIFAGGLKGAAAWALLARGAAWAVVLGAALAALWRLATRHLTVHGG